jgi:hypothetical protein
MSEPWASPDVIRHVQRLLASFQRWTGRGLLAANGFGTVEGDAAAIARLVYALPFVVVAHGTGADPVFVFGNRIAQLLWELDWPAFTRLPSRRSAEVAHVEERQRWLDTAARQGYVEGCHGVRASASGRRFLIQDVTIWNVVDEDGGALGQAATYRTWTYL